MYIMYTVLCKDPLDVLQTWKELQVASSSISCVLTDESYGDHFLEFQ